MFTPLPHYDLGSILLLNLMNIPYFSVLLLTLQPYHPSYSSLSSYPPLPMHTHDLSQVPAICSDTLSMGPRSILVPSTALQVSSPFSYCTVAGFRPISLLQRYVILLSGALPLPIPSLLVHSTIESVFLPGYQLRSANRLLRINGTEDLGLSSYTWASIVTWTTLSSIY